MCPRIHEKGAVQKTRLDAGISFKPGRMIFQGGTVLLGRQSNLRSLPHVRSNHLLPLFEKLVPSSPYKRMTHSYHQMRFQYFLGPLVASQCCHTPFHGFKPRRTPPQIHTPKLPQSSACPQISAATWTQEGLEFPIRHVASQVQPMFQLGG